MLTTPLLICFPVLVSLASYMCHRPLFFPSRAHVHSTGSFITVGLPDNNFPSLSPFTFAPNGSKLGGSHIGSKVEALQMLQLAADKGIKPWIETLPMKDVGKAVQGVKDNKVRYRYVLTQDLVAGEGNNVL